MFNGKDDKIMVKIRVKIRVKVQNSKLVSNSGSGFRVRIQGQDSGFRVKLRIKLRVIIGSQAQE